MGIDIHDLSHAQGWEYGRNKIQKNDDHSCLYALHLPSHPTDISQGTAITGWATQ